MHKDKDWWVTIEKEETFMRLSHGEEREMSAAKIGG